MYAILFAMRECLLHLDLSQKAEKFELENTQGAYLKQVNESHGWLKDASPHSTTPEGRLL